MRNCTKCLFADATNTLKGIPFSQFRTPYLQAPSSITLPLRIVANGDSRSGLGLPEAESRFAPESNIRLSEVKLNPYSSTGCWGSSGLSSSTFGLLGWPIALNANTLPIADPRGVILDSPLLSGCDSIDVDMVFSIQYVVS